MHSCCAGSSVQIPTHISRSQQLSILDLRSQFFSNNTSQYLSSFPDHDIVVVTISNAQDVSSYTVASAGQRELFYGLIEFVPGEE